MYVNQDCVSQRELPIGSPRSGVFPAPKRRVKLTKREQQILTLLAAGKTITEMSETLEITKGNTRFIIHTLRKKLPR
jgi:DNA-binding NarL/FixJ family response regulator